MILHIFRTPFQHESRVLKECHAISESGSNHEFVVAALWEPGLSLEEKIDGGISVWRVALKTRNWSKSLPIQLIKYLEWMIRIVVRMRSANPAVIHAHGISALPVGVILKWLTRAPVIYDAHELESETNGLSRLRSKLARWTESLWIRPVNRTITVCDSIADWYANAYPIERPEVIRNVPMRSGAPLEKTTILRDLHGISTGDLIFLYQGALSPGRGVETLIDVFSDVDRTKHLVLMGYGVLEDRVRSAAIKYSNIHFQEAVPPDRVLYHTASADIGLCLIENTCLSYYYSLPNKLFEYLLSGLPVLINDMPEQRNIVEQFECGWVVPPTADRQKALIESIDAAQVEARKSGAKRAAGSFDWQEEAVRLQALYAEILG